MTPDHYEVLGVSREATDDEIKRAHRKVLKQVHPDYGGNSALFRVVQTAWEVLGDPTARAAYDLANGYLREAPGADSDFHTRQGSNQERQSAHSEREQAEREEADRERQEQARREQERQRAERQAQRERAVQQERERAERQAERERAAQQEREREARDRRRIQRIRAVVGAACAILLIAGSAVAIGVALNAEPSSSDDRNPPSTQIASDQSIPADESGGEPLLPSIPVTAPSFNVFGGNESRYDATYSAIVESVAGEGLSVRVAFRAEGRSDLRRPESSCLRISGADGMQYVARPTALRLSSDAPGYFAGDITFPTLITGDYGFQYSCADDYTTALIGSVTVPSNGVSRYSESYYATLFDIDGSQVRFVAHGESDLRQPASSCVRSGEVVANPTVTVDADYEFENRARTVQGVMLFAGAVVGATFIYSCDDYSPVVLGAPQ